ncbi:hypothetical protein BJ546DRAFT_422000 [Cryomyces antarcticus]
MANTFRTPRAPRAPGGGPPGSENSHHNRSKSEVDRVIDYMNTGKTLPYSGTVKDHETRMRLQRDPPMELPDLVGRSLAPASRDPFYENPVAYLPSDLLDSPPQLQPTTPAFPSTAIGCYSSNTHLPSHTRQDSNERRLSSQSHPASMTRSPSCSARVPHTEPAYHSHHRNPEYQSPSHSRYVSMSPTPSYDIQLLQNESPSHSPENSKAQSPFEDGRSSNIKPPSNPSYKSDARSSSQHGLFSSSTNRQSLQGSRHTKSSMADHSSPANVPEIDGQPTAINMAYKLGVVTTETEALKSQMEIMTQDRDRLRGDCEALGLRMNSNEAVLLSMQAQIAQTTRKIDALTLRSGNASQSLAVVPWHIGDRVRYSTDTFATPATPSHHRPIQSRYYETPSRGERGDERDTLALTPWQPAPKFMPTKSTGYLTEPEVMGRQSLSVNIINLFSNAEKWVRRWCVVAMSTTVKTLVVQAFLDACSNLTTRRVAEELLSDPELRLLLVAALVNRRVCGEVLNSQCLRQFRSASTVEFCALVQRAYHLQHTRNDTEAILELHSITKQISHVVFAMQKEPGFTEWCNMGVDAMTSEVINILRPLIDSRAIEQAQRAMQGLFQDAYKIATRMRTEFCDWDLTFLGNGERYDSDSMCYRNSGLMGQIGEVTSARYNVKLSISPTVIRKDFSTGALKIETVYKAEVLLTLKRRKE